MTVDPERLYLWPPAGASDGWLAALKRIAGRFPGPTELVVVAGARRMTLGDGYQVEGGNAWLLAQLEEITQRDPAIGFRGVQRHLVERA